MKSILQQLYDGEIYPAEQFLPLEKEYRKIYQQHYRDYDDFIETLSKLEPPLDKRFIEIMENQLAKVPHEFSELFINGFRLGAKMMAEVFEYKQ